MRPPPFSSGSTPKASTTAQCSRSPTVFLWLSQAVDRNSVVRKLQVMKMRGQGQIPGLHTARITDAGYSVFPRLLKPPEIISEHPLKHRLKTGVAGPPQLMDGGGPTRDSVLGARPSSSGETRV